MPLFGKSAPVHKDPVEGTATIGPGEGLFQVPTPLPDTGDDMWFTVRSDPNQPPASVAPQNDVVVFSLHREGHGRGDTRGHDRRPWTLNIAYNTEDTKIVEWTARSR